MSSLHPSQCPHDFNCIGLKLIDKSLIKLPLVDQNRISGFFCKEWINSKVQSFTVVFFNRAKDISLKRMSLTIVHSKCRKNFAYQTFIISVLILWTINLDSFAQEKNNNYQVAKNVTSNGNKVGPLELRTVFQCRTDGCSFKVRSNRITSELAQHLKVKKNITTNCKICF